MRWLGLRINGSRCARKAGAELEDGAGMDAGSAGLGVAEKCVDLFQGAEETGEARRTEVRGAAIAVEIRGAELAVFGDDGAAHGAIFVGSLSPHFVV